MPRQQNDFFYMLTNKDRNSNLAQQTDVNHKNNSRRLPFPDTVRSDTDGMLRTTRLLHQNRVPPPQAVVFGPHFLTHSSI